MFPFRPLLFLLLYRRSLVLSIVFFFFNDTATTEIYTLSLHDALPIRTRWPQYGAIARSRAWPADRRSEEHTSELQSPVHLVCRLLLEKKKTYRTNLQHDKQIKQEKHEQQARLLL